MTGSKFRVQSSQFKEPETRDSQHPTSNIQHPSSNSESELGTRNSELGTPSCFPFSPFSLFPILILFVLSTLYASPVPQPPSAEPDVQNPVRDVSEMMKQAGELLGKLETGTPTQDEQKKILEELDRLIDLAQQSQSSSKQRQQQQNQSESQPQPQPQNSESRGNSPAQAERNIPRAVGPAAGSEPPDLREIWGKLPDTKRDEVLQLLNEKLPMQYKELIKQYFKALSEKK